MKASSPTKSRSMASLKIGDWVRVRSSSEVEATLTNGRLQGLPFMPEMAPFCEKPFRLKRFATKMCVNSESVEICSLENCVVLQTTDRCDGGFHGGCDMGCDFIWKLDWLEPVAQPAEASSDNANEIDAGFQSRLVQLAGPAATRLDEPGQSRPTGSYCCQATELVHSTQRVSAFQFKQYLSDSKLNNVSKASIAKFIASLVLKKITRRPDSLVGPCRGRTPASKPLEIGDRVRVNDIDEIRETLDPVGCNRGLWFDRKEMAAFCGQELIVSRKIERLIDEKTGKLKILKTPSYVLSETSCSGVFRRFCTRGMLHFWREAWLTKLD